MAFIKSEVMAKDLQKGDIFRTIESVGNLRQTMEYEVVGAITATSMPHPSFPELILHDVSFKVKNRHNGKGKTKKYRADCVLTVWRQA